MAANKNNDQHSYSYNDESIDEVPRAQALTMNQNDKKSSIYEARTFSRDDSQHGFVLQQSKQTYDQMTL